MIRLEATGVLTLEADTPENFLKALEALGGPEGIKQLIAAKQGSGWDYTVPVPYTPAPNTWWTSSPVRSPTVGSPTITVY